MVLAEEVLVGAVAQALLVGPVEAQGREAEQGRLVALPEAAA